MEGRHVTHNRYNEGLLIGAGKLHNSDGQKKSFLSLSARYRNKAELEFKGEESTYRGIFCFINFIEETNTVVFGSIGPVKEYCSRTGRLIEKEIAEDKIVAEDATETAVAV